MSSRAPARIRSSRGTLAELLTPDSPLSDPKVVAASGPDWTPLERISAQNSALGCELDVPGRLRMSMDGSRAGFEPRPLTVRALVGLNTAHVCVANYRSSGVAPLARLGASWPKFRSG